MDDDATPGSTGDKSDEGLLGTPGPMDIPPQDVDAPWEPSGVKVSIPTADLGVPPPRAAPAPVRALRDPGHLTRGVGWSIALLGAFLYLYAVWSTADRVLRGVPEAARRVDIAGTPILLGSLALGVAAVGLLVLAVGYLVPERRPVPTLPGSPAYEGYVEDVALRARMNNGWRWAGLVLLVVGLLLALYPLRQAAGGADLSTFDAAGTTFRTHSVGMAVAALGAVLFLVLGARQRPLDELVRETQAHRTLHARAGPLEAESWPEEAVPPVTSERRSGPSGP